MNGKTIRLEHRAASLLTFLCRHHQELVLHQDIIDEVWEGRSISSNSVAVVIADIRRALGDNARKPAYIETLPKRGYRLIADVVYPEPEVKKPISISNPSSSRLWKHLGFLGLVATGLFVVLTFLFKPAQAPSQVASLLILQVENRTEDPGYDALSQALTELIMTEVMRTGQFTIGPDKEATLSLDGRVIIWNGEAALSLKARRVSDQTVVWSGMAGGPEARLPAQTRREIGEFAASLGRP